MVDYFRAIPQTDPARPDDALPLAGGWSWFTQVEHLRRDAPSRIVPASEIPSDVREAITAPRDRIAGLRMDRPHIMGILNVTPDSFSDGGEHYGPARALAHARRMVDAGATLVDIGGESTRPGASFVPHEAEIARTAPAIAAVTNVVGVPVSIDTRKAEVASAALENGAALVNDVSGFTYDPKLAPLCAKAGVPVCVMHAQGDPATMQDNPTYDDVLLDVYDFLAAQVAFLTGLGIPRSQIIVDPGIGFGKTLHHNLALLSRISLFHALGCPILLGASRKGFIRTIGNAPDPKARSCGSVAVALEGIAQGVQIVRAHDVEDTRQALLLWQAVTTGEYNAA
ncbi:dihydropteroate synthase [Shimia biformata]|uniref:dihydropteroate synthase n=1 Tax=Shimia biformata TaxID=1294299 RepID=UPI001950C10E|nr:dihydropteroate synthase [Shimia biformata]